MRFFIIAVILGMSTVGQAAVEDFNKQIQQTTMSEKLLRKRLLKILQNSQVSIAAVSEKDLKKPTAAAGEDFEVVLVKAH